MAAIVPQDEVRIKSGAFAGMTGTVMSVADAEARRFLVPRGMVCVKFLIFGREVLAALEPEQLEKEDNSN
jgi:transcription antitermination factor NusG